MKPERKDAPSTTIYAFVMFQIHFVGGMLLSLWFFSTPIGAPSAIGAFIVAAPVALFYERRRLHGDDV